MGILQAAGAASSVTKTDISSTVAEAVPASGNLALRVAQIVLNPGATNTEAWITKYDGSTDTVLLKVPRKTTLDDIYLLADRGDSIRVQATGAATDSYVQLSGEHVYRGLGHVIAAYADEGTANNNTKYATLYTPTVASPIGATKTQYKRLQVHRAWVATDASGSQTADVGYAFDNAGANYTISAVSTANPAVLTIGTHSRAVGQIIHGVVISGNTGSGVLNGTWTAEITSTTQMSIPLDNSGGGATGDGTVTNFVAFDGATAAATASEDTKLSYWVPQGQYVLIRNVSGAASVKKAYGYFHGVEA